MTRACPPNPRGTRRHPTGWAARLALFIAALLVAMPGVAAGKARYFCERMDRLADDCCCPSARSASLPGPVQLTAELEAADCCQRLEGATARAVVATPPTFPDVTFALIEPALPEVAIAARDARDAPEPWTRAERPPRGPPLFIVHCALLL